MQAVRNVASGGKFYRLPPDKEDTATAPAVHTNPKTFLNRISFSRIFVWMRPETTLESVLNGCGFGDRIHWFRVDDLCGLGVREGNHKSQPVGGGVCYS